MEDEGLRDRLAVERTALANERTLLAYLRTGLALVAGGAALIRFFPDDGLIDAAAWLLMAAGAGTAVLGALRFKAVQRRLRTR